MCNHNYTFKDYIYENHMRYYYNLEEMLIVLGINWDGILLSVEMFHDNSIINNRLEVFKN